MLSKKLAILTSIYAGMCFVFVMIFSLIATNTSALLELDVFSYKMLNGLSLYFQFLPSIIAAVFFVVVATYVDSNGERNIKRFSSVQMEHFQRIMLVICVNVGFLFCASEVFLPLINSSKLERENRYDDYNWYVDESKTSFENNDILSALYFIENAISIFPTSQDALELKEVYERAPAETASETLQYFPEFVDVDVDDALSTSSTVLSMLKKARDAFLAQQYFDAHYYAFVGLELGGNDNANSEELQRISLDAWNILETWSGFDTDENMRVYNLKRQGYAALIEGDALSAYYLFLGLYNDVPYDPDVIRYFELSKNALLNEYFFIDETLNLNHFEKSKNVSFSVTRNDGLLYDIKIGGITNVKTAGNFLKYLRNYSCSVKDSLGNELYAFSVPYVKLIGQPTTNISFETMKTLNVTESDLVPRLLYTSVDRNTKGVISGPVFSTGEGNMLDDSLTFLPMTLEDFDLIIDASIGPQYINLASLFNFIPKADSYGFSAHVYSSYFLQRAVYPFLLIAVFLFLAVQAWNFRLEENSIFRFYWVLIVPIFTIVAELIRVLFSYGVRLIALAFSRIEGMLQIPAMIVAFVIVIIILAIRFLSLYPARSKNAK